MEFFGEQTVQMAMAALDAALWVLAGVLLIVLSVHVARAAFRRPMLARVPQRMGRIVELDGGDVVSSIGLHTSLAARAPPVSSLRPSPAPPRATGSGS